MIQKRLLTAGIVIASVLTASTPVRSASPQFSIEDLLSAPFPTHLTASRQGRVAWVFNEQGARNVWLAEPPDYQGRRWTGWTEDDGQTLYDLNWTADGENLLFVRETGPTARENSPIPCIVSRGPNRPCGSSHGKTPPLVGLQRAGARNPLPRGTVSRS